MGDTETQYGLRPIVIAEEYPDDADLIARKFRSANVRHPIVILYDSDDVIAYLSEQLAMQSQPSVLFTNLTLMNGNARRLISWVQCQPQLRDVKFIVFNDAKRKVDRECGMATNVVQVWDKFPPEEMFASTIRELV